MVQHRPNPNRRQRALAWLLGPTDPFARRIGWDAFLEDIRFPYPAGPTAASINAPDTAKYCVDTRMDGNYWQMHVPASWQQSGQVSGPETTQLAYAGSLREQQQVPKAMGSLPARYAAVKAFVVGKKRVIQRRTNSGLPRI